MFFGRAKDDGGSLMMSETLRAASPVKVAQEITFACSSLFQVLLGGPIGNEQGIGLNPGGGRRVGPKRGARGQVGHGGSVPEQGVVDQVSLIVEGGEGFEGSRGKAGGEVVDGVAGLSRWKVGANQLLSLVVVFEKRKDANAALVVKPAGIEACRPDMGSRDGLFERNVLALKSGFDSAQAFV